MNNQQTQLDRFREAANAATPPASTVMFEMIARIEGMESAPLSPDLITQDDVRMLESLHFYMTVHSESPECGMDLFRLAQRLKVMLADAPKPPESTSTTHEGEKS